MLKILTYSHLCAYATRLMISENQTVFEYEILNRIDMTHKMCTAMNNIHITALAKIID